jgi:hypothetical protein
MTDFDNPNNQYIDSVRQVNHEMLEHTEAVALGSLYQSVSHALSLGAMNAVTAQQQSNITAQAVTTMGATIIYTMSTASDTLYDARQAIPAGVQNQDGVNKILPAQ